MAKEVSTMYDSVQIFWSAHYPGDIVEVKVQDTGKRIVYVSEDVVRQKDEEIEELKRIINDSKH